MTIGLAQPSPHALSEAARRGTTRSMDKDLAAAGWVPETDDGFVGHVGGLLRREHDGALQFAFIARRFHANRNGVVHGGMLMTFCDRAFGRTARLATDAVRGATIDLSCQFLAPARIGDLVVLAPQITKSTPRMVFVTGTAVVNGEPVVMAHGIFRMVRPAG